MLFEINERDYPVVLDLRYGTSNNVTGKVIYTNPRCFLHSDAKILFEKSIEFAANQNLRLKIFDAFRPEKAQHCLWNYCPDETFVIPPERGSQHTRGIAIDLTLIDKNGVELDMGTTFDDFTSKAYHSTMCSYEVQKNRFILLGIMMSAGWDFYIKEWWHYQLFNPKAYDLIKDSYGMMN